MVIVANLTNGVWELHAETAAELAAAKAAQIVTINAACSVALAALTAAYPDLEVATWPQQLADANAYTANSSAATPMLSAIASASGQGVAALAAGVLAKSTAYQTASGAAIGKRMALTAQVQAATTIEAVMAIVWT
uniref:hypothetical protein n=1 Tax=Burkholderia diffusa TaxID=488732 RepID=UPI001CC7B046|nr:hypothetical protein [Burkholderia diffusa]